LNHGSTEENESTEESRLGRGCFDSRNSPVLLSQLPIEITFEDVPVGRARIDLVIAEQIVLELKAVDRLHDLHLAQLKSYLRAGHLHLGLLLNFNSATLTIKRVIID
jgi:GxxExxY protein